MKSKIAILSRSNSPFPVGGHAPVADELDAPNLPVKGDLPRGLNGCLVRSGAAGPGGAALLHAVYLEDGQARYRSRRVRTDDFPGGSPQLVVGQAGGLLALSETGRPCRLNRDLTAPDSVRWPHLAPGVLLSHPKLDPETGEMVLLANDPRECRMDLLTVGGCGTLRKSISFDSPWPAIVHDIAVTRNYAIVFICPFVLEEPVPCWRPVMGTAVALIPRRGTELGIRWLETRPFFHLHVMNAFEKDQGIELQLPRYASSPEAEFPTAELHRLRINLENRTIQQEQLDDCPIEFPRINDRFARRENRFGYAAFRNSQPGQPAPQGCFEALVGYDLESGHRTVHTLASGEFVGEPVFVPAENARDEADGYVMALVSNVRQGRSELRFYAAQDLDSPALAQIELPCLVPAGGHNSWVSSVREPGA